jgi:lysophospholipase L1-like esterase
MASPGRIARAVSPRLRSFLGRLALALGSLAVALLVLELVARATGLLAPPEPAVRRMVDARWTTLLDCYPSNPRGYFEINLRQPAAAERYRGIAPHRFAEIARGHPWAVESRYNSLRFRDREPDAKHPGVLRVLVFGDSFAEGQGVKEKDTLAVRLGQRLEERAPGRFEVRNAGRRGLDFPELSEAFEKALVYEPDLVVYALTLNDAVQPKEFRARQSFVNDWILDRERSPDEPAPSGHGLRVFDFVRQRLEAWRVGRATTAWYLDMWSDRNPGWRETGERLRSMKRSLDARGARLLVAPWPLLVGLERGYPFAEAHQAIERFCLSAGIAHHDLLAAFQGRRTAELWVHPVDHHPNEVAQRLAADSLAPVVAGLARP